MSCEFYIIDQEPDEIQTKFLIHFNEIHDPTFVPKCNDDLIVEYQKLVKKLTQILRN